MSVVLFDVYCTNCNELNVHIFVDGCSECGSHYFVFLPASVHDKQPTKLRKPTAKEWQDTINI